MLKQKKKTQTEQLKEFVEIKCKKCGSEDVHINYESEGAYSEYTQWSSSVTLFCNNCKSSLYLNAD